MRTGIVGLGPHGQRILKAIAGVPTLSLVSAVDRDSTVLEGLGDSVRRYTRLEDALGDDLDLLCIATNGPSHAPLALAAIEAGVRHVFVEKPMACSVAECEAMLDAAARQGARIAVDHPRRYSPAYRFLRDGIREGAWGQLRAIHVQRPGIGLGCLATHSYDLIRFLSDREVVRVTGWVDPPVRPNPRGEDFIDPGGMSVLELEGGGRATVVQIEDGAGPMSVQIDLTSARIRLCEKSPRLEIIERDHSVKKRPGVPAAYDVQIAPEGHDGSRSLVGEITSLLADFVDGSEEVSGAVGLASIEILVATYESHDHGNQPIELPLSESARERWLPVT